MLGTLQRDEEWKALQITIATLQEEIEKLKSVNLEMAGRLEAAATSQETFRSQISSLKGINTTQQDDIGSLRTEIVEVKRKYGGLNAERVALQTQVLDLEVSLGLYRIVG